MGPEETPRAHYTSGPEPSTNVFAEQVAGSHYKDLGQYQPWLVFPHWYSKEELRAFAKMTAVVYLQRVKSEDPDEDIRKAMHTLQLYLEASKKCRR